MNHDEKRRRNWERRNAALFHDELTAQLEASVAHATLSATLSPAEVIGLYEAVERIIRRKLEEGDDYAMRQ